MVPEGSRTTLLVDCWHERQLCKEDLRFASDHCVSCVAFMFVDLTKLSSVLFFPAGSWICKLSVWTSSHTWESWTRLLPCVLHPSPPAEAGGPADAPFSSPHLQFRRDSHAYIFFTAAFQTRRVALQRPRQTAPEKPACSSLRPAFGGAAQSARLVSEPLCLFRV